MSGLQVWCVCFCCVSASFQKPRDEERFSVEQTVLDRYSPLTELLLIKLPDQDSGHSLGFI